MAMKVFLLGTAIIILTHFVSLVAMAQSTPYPVFNGYQVLELTGTTLTRFNLEASAWTSNSLVSSNITATCGGKLLLGGYNILQKGGYFQRVYTSLPPHNSIYFQVRSTIIDNWQSGDALEIDIDGESFLSYNLAYAKSVASTNLCGQSNVKDLATYTMIGQMPHSVDNVTFKIISKINRPPNVASFGVREISIIFANELVVPNPTSCYRGFDNMIFGAAGECKCVRGSYPNPSNISQCLACDSSCADCFGPAAEECYVCKDGYSFTGTKCTQCHSTCLTCSGPNENQCTTCQSGLWLHPNNTCQSYCSYPPQGQEEIDDFRICKPPCPTNEYFLWDNTCINSCDPPLVQNMVDGALRCDKPCQTGEFLYSNKSCQPVCDAPLSKQTQNTIDVCIYTCLSGQFLYWNSSCIDVCSFPLIARTDSDGNQYCDYPCPSTKILFEDGTCLNSCDSPLQLKIEGTKQFCLNRCPTNEYLFQNGSCALECPSPLISEQDGQTRLCNPPCPTPSDYLYKSDGSCKSTCDSPFVTSEVQGILLCLPSETISEEEKAEVQKTVETINTIGKAASAGASVAAVTSSASPNALSLASLVKMLQYIRYMDINYPPKLEIMLQNQDPGSISLNFGPDLPKDIEDKFAKYPLPSQFEKYNLHSNFLVNYWEEIGSLFIIMTIIILSSLIVLCTKKWKYVSTIFLRIRNIAKWDLFLMVLCSNYDGLAFFGSLQLRTTTIDSITSILGCLFSIAFNVLGIFVLVRILYIIVDLRRAKYKMVSPSSPREGPTSALKSHETCKILYVSFKDTSFFQQSFMFFFLGRVYLFDIVIGCLFDYPLIQSVIILSMNLMMLSYLAIKRPFKDKANLFEFLVNETILLVVNVNVLILAILDKMDLEVMETRILSGNTIIYANFGFNIMALVFLASELITHLYKAYKAIKASKKGKRGGLCMNLFIIFMEKDGMEIEEISNQDSKPPTSDPNLKERGSLVSKPPPKRLFIDIDAIKANKEIESPTDDLESSCQTPKQLLISDELKSRIIKRNSCRTPTSPGTPETIELPSIDPLYSTRRSGRGKSKFYPAFQIDALSAENEGFNSNNEEELDSKRDLSFLPGYDIMKDNDLSRTSQSFNTGETSIPVKSFKRRKIRHASSINPQAIMLAENSPKSSFYSGFEDRAKQVDLNQRKFRYSGFNFKQKDPQEN